MSAGFTEVFKTQKKSACNSGLFLMRSRKGREFFNNRKGCDDAASQKI